MMKFLLALLVAKASASCMPPKTVERRNSGETCTEKTCGEGCKWVCGETCCSGTTVSKEGVCMTTRAGPMEAECDETTLYKCGLSKKDGCKSLCMDGECVEECTTDGGFTFLDGEVMIDPIEMDGGFAPIDGEVMIDPGEVMEDCPAKCTGMLNANMKMKYDQVKAMNDKYDQDMAMNERRLLFAATPHTASGESQHNPEMDHLSEGDCLTWIINCDGCHQPDFGCR